MQLEASAGARFLLGTVERRVTQGGIEALGNADNAVEDTLQLFLLAQAHGVF
ncbi:hypothetical protein D3C80_2057230 [compost metagenome]